MSAKTRLTSGGLRRKSPHGHLGSQLHLLPDLGQVPHDSGWQKTNRHSFAETCQREAAKASCDSPTRSNCPSWICVLNDLGSVH